MPLLLTIKVVTRAKQNAVQKISDLEYRVKTTAPREKGKANQAVIKLLAQYFQLPKSGVILVSGETSNIKQVLLKK